MSKLPCPLSLTSEISDKLFLEGSTSITYGELESYTQEISNFISKFPKNSTFAYIPKDIPFFCALLFACLREDHVLFPISPRLPSREVKAALKRANTTHFFEEPIPYKKKPLTQKESLLDLDQTATYLLTSGTTSTPKICIHTFANHYYSALGSYSHLNYDSNSKWLLSLPLFHISGLSLIFRTVVAKATLVEVERSLEKTIENKELTHISLVPTQLQRLINLKSLKKLSCILLGGAPIPSSLLQEAQEKKLPLYPTYGLTEMSSQVTTFNPKLNKMALLPYRELKLNSNGEVLVKGETLFKGYLEDRKIISPFDKEGYFETHDLASYENEDFKYLGRQDNLFISGGENIQPEEIEKALLTHPQIQEALVLPKPDSEFGHRPFALISTKEALDFEVLNDYLLKHLPKFKLPVGYAPLYYTGLKPSRKKLLQEYFKNPIAL